MPTSLPCVPSFDCQLCSQLQPLTNCTQEATDNGSNTESLPITWETTAEFQITETWLSPDCGRNLESKPWQGDVCHVGSLSSKMKRKYFSEASQVALYASVHIPVRACLCVTHFKSNIYAQESWNQKKFVPHRE